MTDAFDQFWEWRRKPGSGVEIPAELYHAVMSLPEPDRLNRRKVNSEVHRRARSRRTGRTVWMYLNDYGGGKRRCIGDPEWIKLFASGAAADKWLESNDPEGVAWEHEIEGGQRRRSVFIYLCDENSRAVEDPDWVKLFASKPETQKWLEQHAPKGKIWEYPVEE